MKPRLGISTKLIFMVTVIIVTAIMAIVAIATHEFREDSLVRVQEANKDYAETLATQSFAVFKNAAEKMSIMAETVVQAKTENLPTVNESILNLLRQNDELISFGFYEINLETKVLDEKYFIAKDESLAEFSVKLADFKSKPLTGLEKKLWRSPDEVAIVNSSASVGFPLLSVGFLTKENSSKKRFMVRADMRQDPLLRPFQQKKLVTSYLVDQDGQVLVHSDPKFTVRGGDLSGLAIIQKLKERKLNNHQMEFSDLDGIALLGAFKSVGVAGLAVVAQTRKADALATVDRVQRRALLVTAIIVCLAFLVNFFFSMSMTKPLNALVDATEKIAKGNFHLNLKAKSNDEIGILTQAFQKMTLGLQERDKLKTTFGKLHSEEIAKKIMSGSVHLGGERKTATVFFSDIRDFTTISESMTPDQVVLMLNEYMTEMVKVIYKWHGVVDKYVGDAIMALWGVPDAHPEDTMNAVMAALEMRDVLAQLNKRREARGQVALRMGMGVHTGPLLAGYMGSEQRLEYTVIGDTVNQASRIESSNKTVGSDLLISDSTYALVKRQIVVGPSLSIFVKGKTQECVVHQVIGHKDSSGRLHTSLSPERQRAIMELKALAAGNGHLTAESASAFVPVTEGQMRAAVVVEEPSVDFGAGVEAASEPVVVSESVSSSGQLTRVEPLKPVASPAWYLVKDATRDEYEGPFTLEQLRACVAQAGFPFESSYVFQQGDPEMRPLSAVPELGRRREMPPISAPLPGNEIVETAQAEEWYIYGAENKTYGPYSVDQLKEALEKGHITRTTYAWRKGEANWVYVYQIPGFDRRNASSMASTSPRALPLTHIKKSS